MKNKLFNKLSFRYKGGHAHKPSVVDVDQLQDSSPPSFVFFSQANKSCTGGGKKAVVDIQICLSQSLKVESSTNRESGSHNCSKRHYALPGRVCGRYNTSSVAKLVSPKVVEIVLESPTGMKMSKKSESIHSMNSFSKIESTDRDIKESQPQAKRSIRKESTTLTRSFSSKTNTNGDLPGRYLRKQSVDRLATSCSKTFNRIFGGNTSHQVQKKQVNTGGIFCFPVKGHSRYAQPYRMPRTQINQTRHSQPSVANIQITGKQSLKGRARYEPPPQQNSPTKALPHPPRRSTQLWRTNT